MSTTKVRDFTWINISDQQDRSLPDGIKISLPLQVEDEDLMPKRRGGRTPTRSQNAFFVYRIAYAKELQSRGFWDCPMRDIIKHASCAWKTESSDVKEACQAKAQKAKKLHEKFFPSPRSRRYKQTNQEVSPILAKHIGIVYDVRLPGIGGMESVLITNATSGRHEMLYPQSIDSSLPITFIDSSPQVYTQQSYEFGFYDTPQPCMHTFCD
ncbi:11325_t:CDS:1 [Paraglomus brasilianum]|uniref:11325_t:CDS:1 n=1 Tax=Paraglomus brasilianum TaxID=144538 RepID=A0A9N9FEE5_9GLOM|nr:11325_t:CDS:1 [Paraglomus brasilianum]